MMTATIEVPELRIFPLHGITPEGACTCNVGAACKDVGKHPAVRRWREYEENERGPSGGYGIPTGSINGIFVVDLDVKDGKDGIANFLALGSVPDTAAVMTPSGGVHLYFKLPEGVFVPNSRGKLGEGIDVRGEGGYVVGPGSPHKSGGEYREEPGDLANPPAWLLELVVKPLDDKPEPTEHRTVEPTSPAGVRAIAWAKTYLASAEPAVEGRGGSDRLYHVACHLMYSALPLDVLQQLVEEVYNPRCQPPWSQREIEHKLADADRLSEAPRGLCSPDFLLGLAGRTTDTNARAPDPMHEYTFKIGMRSGTELRKATFNELTGDLFDHVDWAGVLAFDTFRDRVIAVDPPMQLDAETSGLSDNDVQLIRAWFEYHGKKLSVLDVRAAIETVAHLRAFDPRQDWLKLLDWDGKARLDGILPNYFQTEDGPYERAIGPRWFISLVARAMTPGCQSDCTLILEGDQGIGKTSAFRALMPVPSWYAETTSGVDSKDFYENLRGVWLMAFDELDSLTRGSLTKVKTVLTSTRDRYRNAYGHYANDYPRTAGFCGSTNAEQYFNDPTGGRRLWPVRVLRQIDPPKIAADRDQIWAEAYHRWRAGEAWHVDTPKLRKLCEEEQEARLEVDPWESAINAWLRNPAKVSWKALAPVAPGSAFAGVRPYDASRGVTTDAVLEHGVQKLRGQWTAGDVQRVARVLRRLGMKRVQVRTGPSRDWRYVF